MDRQFYTNKMKTDFSANVPIFLLQLAVLVLFLWILNWKMKLIQVMNCLYKCWNFCLSLKDLDVRCFLFVPLQWLHFSKWGERLFQKPKLRQTETSMRLWNYGAALLYVHLHSKRLQKLNIVKQWLGASSTSKKNLNLRGLSLNFYVL